MKHSIDFLIFLDMAFGTLTNIYSMLTICRNCATYFGHKVFVHILVGETKMASRLKIKCSVIYAIIDAQYAQIKK